jgi:hypothetical protein
VRKQRTKGGDTLVMFSLVLPVGEVHLSNHVDQAEQLKIEKKYYKILILTLCFNIFSSM